MELVDDRPRLGIDVTLLSSAKRHGIAAYIENVLNAWGKRYLPFRVYLYSNQPIADNVDLCPDFTVRIIEGKPFQLWLRRELPKALVEDGINLFWGPAHNLPRRVQDIKYVLTINDLALFIDKAWGNKKKDAFYQRLFTSSSIRRADHIISISEATKRDLAKFFKVAGDRVTVIYDGGFLPSSETEVHREAVLTGELADLGDFFFYFGDFNLRKNVDGIAKAFSLIAATKPDLKLVMAGCEEQGKVDSLRADIPAELYDRVLFPGFVTQEEKSALLETTRALVFPSRYEGFGIPVIEAQSYNAPVITARNSSLPEVGGESAIYVDDADDIEGIAAAMEAVLTMSKEERTARTAIGCQFASSFTWGRTADETLSCLCRFI